RGAEIAGLGPRVHAREPAVARLVIRLGGHAREGGGAARRQFLLPETGLDWPAAPDHCRLAWLRGRFLARGSLSLSSGRAHLEFVVPAAEAPVLAARLDDLGLPASSRLRRGLGVVTWKSAESIETFLGSIGGSAALLELEARGVARTLRGDLNRVLNAESANLQRSVAAAGRQLAAIDALEADGRLGQQSRTTRAVAETRREIPEASLSDIAERLDLHRSTVQRALDRMELLALHDDEGVGRRVRTRPSGAVAGVSHGRGRPGRTAGSRGPVGRGA
ncbi:MAG: DNA-binding protein WhiA, partial [Chloroflexi bacterium]|nr:DNA-binding protein WhiA [Chloroflexota bacterium]